MNDPHVKAQHLETGLVKSPANVHSVHVEHRPDGYVNLTARQNETRLLFVLDEDDCRHLATLLLAENG